MIKLISSPFFPLFPHSSYVYVFLLPHVVNIPLYICTPSAAFALVSSVVLRQLFLPFLMQNDIRTERFSLRTILLFALNKILLSIYEEISAKMIAIAIHPLNARLKSNMAESEARFAIFFCRCRLPALNSA